MGVEYSSLILEVEMDEPRRWDIRKEVTTLGRWPSNDIVLPDRLVSRHHAQIRRVGTEFILEDGGSTNGTLVNGKAVGASYRLQDGDTIHIPPRFQLRFVEGTATAPIAGARELPRLELGEQEQRATIGGQEVNLSGPQYAFLALLIARDGKVVTREEVVGHVWPEDDPAGISSEAVDALVRRLRERLAQADPDHQYVQTVRGHGFRFENR